MRHWKVRTGGRQMAREPVADSWAPEEMLQNTRHCYLDTLLLLTSPNIRQSSVGETSGIVQYKLQSF